MPGPSGILNVFERKKGGNHFMGLEKIASQETFVDLCARIFNLIYS